MSEDTYKGESPSKKMARASYWRLVADRLGDRFFTGKHVVLASREGGDIGVLTAMGVAPENIVAADIVKSAADACAAKWPSVEVVHGDVADVVERYAKDVRSVFLDFCGPICTETVQVGRRVLRVLKYGSIFGVALLRGRERGEVEVNEERPLNRAARRAIAAMKRKGGTERNAANMMEWQISGRADARVAMEEASEEGDQPSGYKRAKAFLALVHATAVNPWQGVTHAYEIIDYQSVTKESRGVPMSIALCVKERVTQGFTRDSAPHKYRVVSAQHYTDEMIRAYAVSEASGESPHLLLNVDKATIAAWKAHATRGTYDAQPKWACDCPYCRPSSA